jgi:hypothetical protein
MDRDLRFRKFAFALRCLRVCLFASFGHGENSPSKIDFGCDSTKKDCSVRANSYP